MDKRMSAREINMRTAELWAKRGTCKRKNVGCVIAKHGRVLVSGFTGVPAGLPHCIDVGCDIDPETGGCIRTSHAEANAITWAARNGIMIYGAELFTTLAPCISCAKLIITSGISKVYYGEPYRDDRGIAILKRACVPTALYVNENKIEWV